MADEEKVLPEEQQEPTVEIEQPPENVQEDAQEPELVSQGEHKVDEPTGEEPAQTMDHKAEEESKTEETEIEETKAEQISIEENNSVGIKSEEPIEEEPKVAESESQSVESSNKVEYPQPTQETDVVKTTEDTPTSFQIQQVDSLQDKISNAVQGIEEEVPQDVQDAITSEINEGLTDEDEAVEVSQENYEEMMQELSFENEFQQEPETPGMIPDIPPVDVQRAAKIANSSSISSRALPSPNEWQGYQPGRLPILPGHNPTLTYTDRFHMATNTEPTSGSQILANTSCRRRNLTPKFSIQKQQVREIGTAAKTLDPYGFVRPDATNPLIGSDLPPTHVPRDEPHYWQAKKPLPPTTCVMPTVNFSTTHW